MNFPAIPGVQSPKIIPAGKQAGKSLPLLVPQVGEDGNELAGVRTAESVVPMATYTGWNFRNASIGGTDQPREPARLRDSVAADESRARSRSAIRASRSRSAIASRDALPGVGASGRREPGEGRLPARRRCAAGDEADGRAVDGGVDEDNAVVDRQCTACRVRLRRDYSWCLCKQP